MQDSPNIETFGELVDTAGDNRLLLRFVERLLPSLAPGQKAYDFHSLVWEVRDGDNWTQRTVIPQADFARGGPRRWVAELFRFDSTTGTAIVRIGEEQPVEAGGCMHVEYSWREWDLNHNREISVIRHCAEPFEPYDLFGGAVQA